MSNLINRLAKIEEKISPQKYDYFFLVHPGESLEEKIKRYNSEKKGAKLTYEIVIQGRSSSYRNKEGNLILVYIGKDYDADAAIIAYIKERDKNKLTSK